MRCAYVSARVAQGSRNARARSEAAGQQGLHASLLLSRQGRKGTLQTRERKEECNGARQGSVEVEKVSSGARGVPSEKEFRTHVLVCSA